MKSFEMLNAIDEAERTLATADDHVYGMAKIIKKRLRTLSKSYFGNELLKDLKKELSQFNAKTGEWKN